MLDTINKFFEKLPQGNVGNCNQLYTFFVIFGMVIIVYYFTMICFYGEQKTLINKDFLNQKYFDTKCFGPIGPWPISHFVLYFFIGLLFPQCDFIVIMVSIIWELYEQMLKYFTQSPDETTGVLYSGSWWQGNIYDVFINLLGFYLGKFVVYSTGYHLKIPYINS